MSGRQAFLTALLLWLIATVCQAGTASWYGDEVRGLAMANGEPFNPDLFTCASWSYPLGTVLRVCYQGKCVDVTVTDRGPAKRLGREIDLSRAAFEKLAPLRLGLIVVSVVKL
jgi:rare lipoprotein A